MLIENIQKGIAMHIAICEDDKNDQDALMSIITNWAEAKDVTFKVLSFNNAEAFLFAWPEVEVDIVFLDIELKNGKDGITLAKEIREKDSNVQIVFTTSHKQYSLRGYDVYPLHYLVKPLIMKKIFVILDKAYYLSNSHKNDFIIVPNGSEIIRLQTNKIHYIEMSSHNAELHVETGKKITLRKTSDEMLAMLPKHFVRCHRSRIINLLKVDSIYTNHVLLVTGAEVKVSRAERKRVREAFLELN